MPVQCSYTSTPPMDRTACTEPQCLYSLAIPLLLLWTEQTLQSLSACKIYLYLYSPMGRTACTERQCLYSVAIASIPLRAVRPVQYRYTSTPSMCRTAFTEPQCLYSTAIPLFPPWAVQPVQSLSASTV